MHGEEVINELGEEISKGKGCIVFDFDIIILLSILLSPLLFHKNYIYKKDSERFSKPFYFFSTHKMFKCLWMRS